MNIYNEFIKAIKSENVDAIKFFLNFKNFNPTYECNYAIRLAAFLGNNQSLITLLNDQRIDPSDVDNFAVIEAIKQENTETLQILLNDYRIKKEKINNELLIKLALDSKNLSIIKVLINHEKTNPITKALIDLIIFDYKSKKNIISILFNNKIIYDYFKNNHPNHYKTIFKIIIQRKVNEF